MLLLLAVACESDLRLFRAHLPAEPLEVLEDAPSAPALTPSGTFVGTMEVSLALSDGEEARFTRDGSLPDPNQSERWVEPLTIDASTQLRVVVTRVGGALAWGSESYIRVDPDAAAFTSNLPLVVLWTEDRLPEDDLYQSITLQVHDRGAAGRAPLVGVATTAARAGLRVRGSSTAWEPKHSYALETRGDAGDDDLDAALLGMPADSDWVLYAPFQYDRSFLHNALMYQLSNDLGRYAPRTRFVEVYAVGHGETLDSGDYVGVYVLTERIKRGSDRVAVTKLESTDLSDPEVTGGYIFKRDRLGNDEKGFGAGTADGAFWFADQLAYVYPREEAIAPEQAAYLSQTVDGFADALVTGEHWRDHVDEDAWIDHHILNLFAKNPDALRLSAYMYKDRDGPLVAGPIWDFDRAMNPSDDVRAQDPTWWDASHLTWDTTPMFTFGWYGPMFADPEFDAAYWARMAEVLDGPLSVAHVDAVIDGMAAELREAAPRNYARWSDYPPRDGSFEGEITLLKAWIAARHDWIEACLSQADPRACTGA